MRYEDIRQQIADGDILGVSCNGMFWTLIKAVQRFAGLGSYAQITHVGVAWWVNGRLYSVEMDGRHNVLRPLSQHVADGCGVAVFQCPVSADALAQHYDQATANPIKYSLLDLVKIGARLIFGGKTGSDDDGDMVCSTFANRWLQWAGWLPPPLFPEMPCPAELCRALGTPFLTIN